MNKPTCQNVPDYLQDVDGIKFQPRRLFFDKEVVPIERPRIVYGICVDCKAVIDTGFAKAHIRCRTCQKQSGVRDMYGSRGSEAEPQKPSRKPGWSKYRHEVNPVPGIKREVAV